ncbi:MAG: beta-lactamase family protein [Planctomycetota bacterium]|nr:beta-lactamase family protein [Planctomycetaceae bacterium]MDQ3330188.1 beta-lactamase family protein [Planctomycetota bacterium]
MSLNWTDDPVDVGLGPNRFAAAMRLAESWCTSDEIPAIAVVVGRSNACLRPQFFGSMNIARTTPIRSDAIFTVASITKPIVAMAVMLLVERGEITLGDKVTSFIPEFAGKGRYGVRMRHLLTHTSGLPDLLPQDRALRQANASLSAFLSGVCKAELLFPPGRGVAYSSCGFLLLGEIVTRVTGSPLPEFLRTELFEPLAMNNTSLGAPLNWFDGSFRERFAEVRVPAEQADGDSWNWNSRYWRTVGAPWGGLLSTPMDLAAFAHLMLTEGRCGDRQIVSRATIAAAVGNQLEPMREVPEADRRCRPWGFGWRLNWPAHGAWFGDVLSESAYGHWGATGTLLWIDPTFDAFAVLLTTQPQDPDGRYLARLSNALVASLR